MKEMDYCRKCGAKLDKTQTQYSKLNFTDKLLFRIGNASRYDVETGEETEILKRVCPNNFWAVNGHTNTLRVYL